jgi:hypothetical protein
MYTIESHVTVDPTGPCGRPTGVPDIFSSRARADHLWNLSSLYVQIWQRAVVEGFKI